jgi:hypothetical protein
LTPFAHKIVSELTLPARDRTFRDGANIAYDLAEAHCFECSEIVPAMMACFEDKPDVFAKAQTRYAFLPSPRTWIEYKTPFGRIGYYLTTERAEGMVFGSVAVWEDGTFQSVPAMFSFPLFFEGEEANIVQFYDLNHAPPPEVFSVLEGGPQHARFAEVVGVLFGLLAFVNTPRVIGRRQHMPHAGLQRKLAHARGTVGKYPLHAWHEVKLDIAPPRLDRSAIGSPHETRLTGAKALHFVRCHLRIRLGQLELVSAHHRGDPALGIKQTRYRLTNTRPELAPV